MYVERERECVYPTAMLGGEEREAAEGAKARENNGARRRRKCGLLLKTLDFDCWFIYKGGPKEKELQ